MNGIYFIEKDERLISDMADLFEIYPKFQIVGSSNIISAAVEEIKKNPSVKCVVIGQELLDDTFETALKKLAGIPVAKVVTLSRDADSSCKELIDSYEKCGCLVKPYTHDQLSSCISGLIGDSEEVSDEDILNEDVPVPKMTMTDNKPISELSDTDLMDNPFLEGICNADIPDVKERLRSIRREQPQYREDRIIPQKVIVEHNPKGGVGKTTIAVDLAVAIHNVVLRKNNMESNVRVCLCDFDISANDISIMMNFDPHSAKNLGSFIEDLRMETKRVTESKGSPEPIENIRFLPREVEQKYLQFHETGIYVLSAPSDISFSINKGEFKAVIENIKQCDFDIIVIDTGSELTESTAAALIEADTVLGVSTCEITSATRLLNVIHKMNSVPGFLADKFKLVINKHDDRDNITPNELSHLLMMENYAVIPIFKDISNIHNYGYSAFNNQTYVDKNMLGKYIDSMMKLARRTLNIDNKYQQRQEEKKPGFFAGFKRKKSRRKE